ncbi:MAG: hypothetical protein WBE20_12535 [Candidatus Acidiferrales bacterium]
MTLTSLLEINVSLLEWDAQRGLEIAEAAWLEGGQPVERRALAEILEMAITRCARSGVPYPAILLKRKKQLDRSEWKPGVWPQLVNQAATPADECPKCKGLGCIPAPDGSHASLCMECLGKGRAKSASKQEVKP